MIGLGFICKTFQIEYKKLAEILGISDKTINDWVKGRSKIPAKRLKQLSEYFQLPEEYFQKELSPSEKLIIYRVAIQKELGIEIEILIKN